MSTEILLALIEAKDWFEAQAKVISKGGPSSYELWDIREQRDKIYAVLQKQVMTGQFNGMSWADLHTKGN